MKKNQEQHFTQKQLDEITRGLFSKKSSENYQITAERFSETIRRILETEVTRVDTPEIIMKKIEGGIDNLKQKLHLLLMPEEKKSLDNLVNENEGRFLSVKQKNYFKWPLKRKGKPFDDAKDAFHSPVLDYLLPSDIGVLRFSEMKGDRNKIVYFYIIDEEGVRVVVHQFFSYSWKRHDMRSGFSKENYNFTMPRKKEMLYGESRRDEKMEVSEILFFKRK